MANAVNVCTLLAKKRIGVLQCCGRHQHGQSTSVTLCNTLQHSATLCNTLQHSATLYNILQHSTPFCNTATLCNTCQYAVVVL